MKRIEKPWGYEEWWAVTDKYIGKILFVRKGHRLSLQYHNIKEETLRVLSGTARFVLDEETLTLHPGDVVHVKPGQIHRLEATDNDVTVVEVSTPEVEDVVRLSDDYARDRM